LRILFVIPYFYPAASFGGPVRVAYDLGRELVKRGHELVVFTSNAKDWTCRLAAETDLVEGMVVHYFKNLSMFFVSKSNLFLTPDLLRKMQLDLKSFDLVHAHEYTTSQNILLHHFARKYDVPYVLQVHGSLPKLGRAGRKWVFETLFGRRLLRDSSKVIALSRLEAEQYRHVGVPDEKIRVIPNGIDSRGFSDPSVKGSFKRKFGIQDNRKIILYLGRVNRQKGLELLIRAYSHLVKRMSCKNALLVIAGPDDGYLTEARSLVASQGIHDSVLFTGFVDNKEKIGVLADATLFVTPKYCGFPITFLEACSAGTPIVTTTLGDGLEWIDHRVGFVTPPNPFDLARAFDTIISDADLTSQLSRNCRKIVSSDFSLEKVVNKLEQVYAEVVHD